MPRLFITNFDKTRYRPKDLSSLVKPFFDADTGLWSSSPEVLSRRGCGDLGFEIVSTPDNADVVLVSEPLDHRHDRKRYKELRVLNTQCKRRGINAHVFVSGDFGKAHPRFSNVYYYRLGGFKSQLDEHNVGFFPLVSDQLRLLFGRNEIFLREKGSKPKVGFCGHASYSRSKQFYEKAKFAKLNFERMIRGDFHLEPLFASAFERQGLLDLIADSEVIETNFVSRRRYRAGARTEEERRQTTIEYYRNIIDSDYVLCLRGGGNFSVRLYETLMMGRIPIFVNTDCLLPLQGSIEWKRHVVWIDWEDRASVAEKVAEHFSRLDTKEFQKLQLSNRELWKKKLSIREYLATLVEPEYVSEFL